jgi:hypothetical protein
MAVILRHVLVVENRPSNSSLLTTSMEAVTPHVSQRDTRAALNNTADFASWVGLMGIACCVGTATQRSVPMVAALTKIPEFPEDKPLKPPRAKVFAVVR